MWRIQIIGVILLIALTNILTPLHARKFVHVGCGLVLAHINRPTSHLRTVIIAVAVASIVIFKVFPLRFGARNDAGIIWYNLVVLCFVALGLPLRVLLPVFLIDPVACLVGTSYGSTRWYGQKTVLGTLAAVVASYFSLYYVKTETHRMWLTFVLPFTEGVMGQHDNMGISVVVFAYYCAARHFGWPIDLRIKFFE